MAFSSRSIPVACARTAMVVVACCNLGAGAFASTTTNYVVELFKSQGCAYCPRADQWLAAIARAPDVVAVSFPVDYWDYIGWRDTLASPAFTARQKAYAAANGESNVYTPQVIVNGLAGAAGGDRAEIEQAIKTAKGVDGALTVPMHLSETGGHFIVEVAGGSGGPAGVFALRVARASTVQILRGENAGPQRNLYECRPHHQQARRLDWPDRDLPGPAGDGEGFIVLVQKGTPERPGAILAAAKTEGL
jgi:hypothetical protein